MKKDIFIDNNVATRFSNPQDKEYIKLTTWLLEYDSKAVDKDNFAHLVVSQKLLVEYLRSAYNCKAGTSIPIIIGKLQQQNRLIIIKNKDIASFKKEHFTKAIERKFTCNAQDRDLIPVILKSNRKFVLTYDQNFTDDLMTFPGFTVLVKKRPEDIPYR